VTTKAGYWIGGLLIASGIAGAIVWAILAFTHIVDTVGAFDRIPIPGSRTLELGAHKVVIYIEGPGADESTPTVALTVTDARTEQRIPVATYSSSLTYSFDTTGSAVATVTPPRAGRYEIRASAQNPGGFQLAIGESIAGKIVATILGAFAVGGVLLLAGTGLIVVTSVRRSRRRAAAQAPPNPFGA
jgi:hypothetical protein